MSKDDVIIWYVGRDFDDSSRGVFSIIKSCDEFETFALKDLTRHPEGDIKND